MLILNIRTSSFRSVTPVTANFSFDLPLGARLPSNDSKYVHQETPRNREVTTEIKPRDTYPDLGEFHQTHADVNTKRNEVGLSISTASKWTR